MRSNRLSTTILFAGLFASATAMAQNGVPQKAKQSVPALLLTVEPHGFEPSAVTVPAGKYLLIVNNRSGSAQFSFRLLSALNAVLGNLPLASKSSRSTLLVNLVRGKWILQEGTHTNLTCTINVE